VVVVVEQRRRRCLMRSTSFAMCLCVPVGVLDFVFQTTTTMENISCLCELVGHESCDGSVALKTYQKREVGGGGGGRALC
jgi:hypothetical protein